MNQNSNNSTLILIFTCLLPFGIYYNLASSLNVQQTFIVNRISGSFIIGDMMIRGSLRVRQRLTCNFKVISGSFGVSQGHLSRFKIDFNVNDNESRSSGKSF